MELGCGCCETNEGGRAFGCSANVLWRKARCVQASPFFPCGSRVDDLHLSKNLGTNHLDCSCPFLAAIEASAGKQRGNDSAKKELLRTQRYEAGLNNGIRAQRNAGRAAGQGRRSGLEGDRLDCSRTASGARRACFGIRGRRPSFRVSVENNPPCQCSGLSSRPAGIPCPASK